MIQLAGNSFLAHNRRDLHRPTAMPAVPAGSSLICEFVTMQDMPSFNRYFLVETAEDIAQLNAFCDAGQAAFLNYFLCDTETSVSVEQLT